MEAVSVQLLNIAGLGPIFGAMQGALWGPVVFLWITFGTVFAGGVHDYFSGMLSERNDGVSISEVCGICLIIMAIGVIFGIGANNAYVIPEIWSHFHNMHPGGTPIWPFMFITVACGAISGFHATQSPLMARCMKSERQGRFVFYGAMAAEGVIALIWAAAGCSLYKVTGGLSTGLAEIMESGQSAAIYDVCKKTMGGIGIALAMVGEIVWRYFSWTNQTLAMIVLWTASMFLFREKKNYWITVVSAVFMSAVSVTYFFCAPECLGNFGLMRAAAYPAGIIFAVCFLGLFIRATKKQ